MTKNRAPLKCFQWLVTHGRSRNVFKNENPKEKFLICFLNHMQQMFSKSKHILLQYFFMSGLSPWCSKRIFRDRKIYRRNGNDVTPHCVQNPCPPHPLSTGWNCSFKRLLARNLVTINFPTSSILNSMAKDKMPPVFQQSASAARIFFKKFPTFFFVKWLFLNKVAPEFRNVRDLFKKCDF